MAHPQVLRSRIAVVAAIFMLAACSSSGVANVAPATLAYSPSVERTQKDSDGALLYVTNAYTNSIQTYTYPSLRGKATISGGGLNIPQGPCTDGSNIYVPNPGSSNILVYPRGSARPTRTLKDPNLGIACSFDRTTGNLAVANLSLTGPGNIAIYTNARGKPQIVTTTELLNPASLQYDGAGNLFFDGIVAYTATLFYAEIGAGSKQIEILTTPKPLIERSEPLCWDGKHIVIGGIGAVYRLDGTKVVGSTPLVQAQVDSLAIMDDRLMVYHGAVPDLTMYYYPKGGEPEHVLGGSLSFTGRAGRILGAGLVILPPPK